MSFAFDSLFPNSPLPFHPKPTKFKTVECIFRDGGRSKNLGGLDFIGETESEDESLNEQLELNSELDARLSRLALLDQTQQEIDQISVATESMLQQSKNRSPY